MVLIAYPCGDENEIHASKNKIIIKNAKIKTYFAFLALLCTGMAKIVQVVHTGSHGYVYLSKSVS